MVCFEALDCFVFSGFSEVVFCILFSVLFKFVIGNSLV
jgi:hypothetical protein